MADKSKIEWTDATWNPIRGCSVVSEGCRHCYAMNVAARFTAEGQAYEGLAYRNESGAHWTGQVKLIEKHLNDPLHWKRPRRIFVNSMSDLFHESIPDAWIERIFQVMYDAKRHVFQVLTKRPERMLDWISRSAFLSNAPLENVWLGVSVEDQTTANERIPLLLETPAALRWVSAEPLLGPIDLATYYREEGQGTYSTWLDYLDWVVAGGESGPCARPCALEWIEHLVNQCLAANKAVFCKQLGSFVVSESRTAPADWMYHYAPNGEAWAWRGGLMNRKGGDIAEFPSELRVRQYPAAGDFSH